ncbi:hypothetical protein [Alcanivorax sp.]|uniref:hypothetical protein n=1 Tax=Alcanivorax sp. TaxID=1872427 RepID=UPI0025C67814|nr:hypothetical protein [Alcanivorax sp.]
MTPFPFDNDNFYVQFFFLTMSGFMMGCFFWYVLFVKIRKWGRTKGVIIKKIWKKSRVSNEVSGSVDVQYEYTVDGKRYKNNKVGIKDSAFPLFLLGKTLGWREKFIFDPCLIRRFGFITIEKNLVLAVLILVWIRGS